ncbi:hypothetical protein MRX96_000641 [Rhipicephalus microplus]
MMTATTEDTEGQGAGGNEVDVSRGDTVSRRERERTRKAEQRRTTTICVVRARNIICAPMGGEVPCKKKDEGAGLSDVGGSERENKSKKGRPGTRTHNCAFVYIYGVRTCARTHTHTSKQCYGALIFGGRSLISGDPSD